MEVRSGMIVRSHIQSSTKVSVFPASKSVGVTVGVSAGIGVGVGVGVGKESPTSQETGFFTESKGFNEVLLSKNPVSEFPCVSFVGVSAEIGVGIGVGNDLPTPTKETGFFTESVGCDEVFS